ncbi:MAG: hypothetical protein C0402_12415 [Thermodesulfovibrio sp.]|nr:hypothetical protein [Thermodesulfovibrio sp.]
MKKLSIIIFSLVIMIASVVAQNVYAAETSQVSTDHLAMSKSYEDKAAAQDALIAEHEQMKKDYKSRFFINEKLTPMAKLKKMNDHCDAIIKDAQKLKADFNDFAKWHRLRAAELQGK